MAAAAPSLTTAAFFRVEGVLSSRPTLHAAAWLAAASQKVLERLTRLGAIAAAAPFSLPSPFEDRTTGTRLAWSGLRGTSEDRLVILGEEYFETFLRDQVPDVGADLLSQARDRGDRVVLVADNLDTIARPFAAWLGADDVVCNRLELRNGRATGRLAEPAIGGHLSGQWLAAYAAEHGLDLVTSCAYGHARTDATMLSAIGRPCAVNPDRGLRRAARDLDWPIVVG